MLKLTAVMIVRNEESTLPGCVESLRGVADELVILDTGSTDRTGDFLETLASKGPESGFERIETGRIGMTGFGAARAETLRRTRTPWALWIDADERLSDDLKREIRSLLDGDGLERYAAWSIPFINVVLGRSMRCRELGRERRPRLFRTRSCGFSPDPVHETLRIGDGVPVGRLEAPIIHHTMRSWTAYLRKVDLYTRLEAAHTDRRCNPLHMAVTAPATFLRQYLRRTCIIDGRAGLVWALTSAWSAFLRDWRLCVGRPRKQ